jgi:hypothetical protein
MKPNYPQGMDMEQMKRLAESKQGHAMLERLKNTNSKELERAVAQAQAGNYQQLQQTLSEFLNTPTGKELMKQLRG